MQTFDNLCTKSHEIFAPNYLDFMAKFLNKLYTVLWCYKYKLKIIRSTSRYLILMILFFINFFPLALNFVDLSR